MFRTLFRCEHRLIILNQMIDHFFIVSELVHAFSSFVDKIIAEILRDFDRGEGVREVCVFSPVGKYFGMCLHKSMNNSPFEWNFLAVEKCSVEWKYCVLNRCNNHRALLVVIVAERNPLLD